MSYFVVERSAADGSLSVPLPDAYESREAAIAALSAATATGSLTLAGEVFIADLGSAIPVLVMQAVAPPVPDQVQDDFAEPVVPAEPEGVTVLEEEDAPVAAAADEEPGILDEGGSDVVVASWEPGVPLDTDDVSLADALKRATTSLEDEGIVAPASIDGGMEVESLETETASEEVGSSADAEDTAEPGEWPWANVDAYEISADAPVVGDEASETPDDLVAEPAGAEPSIVEPASIVAAVADASDLEEPATEASAIITSAPPEGEEAYVPHPVILGDYGDAESDSVTEEAPDLPPSAEDPSPPEGGYEATGELDLGEYTCQDCVYANTCPKVGQTTPAECGSFQWRSE